MLLQNKQSTSDIEQLYYLVMLLYGICRGRCMCVPDSVRAAGESEEEPRVRD